MESYRQDNTKSTSWLQVEKYFRDLHGPAIGHVSHAADLSISPDGTKIAFTGSIGQSAIGVSSLRICLIDISSTSIEIITGGLNDDKKPQWSRDGNELFFLSDRVAKSSFQLYRLRVRSPEEINQLTFLDGSIEYFSISRTGAKLVIGLASMGSDRAGSEGSGTISTKEVQGNLAEWMPTIEPDPHPTGWRSAWIYNNRTGLILKIGDQNLNIWESGWCGETHLIVLVSETPSEESWYSAKLVTINTEDGTRSVIYDGHQQIGHASASPSGSEVAFVEALCSDRTLVAGRLMHLNRQSGKISPIDIDGDIVQVLWLSDTRLCVTGLRGLETIVAEIDIKTNDIDIILKSRECLGQKYSRVARDGGIIGVVRDSWTRYPEIATIHDGQAKTLLSFDHAGAAQLRAKLGTGEPCSWPSSTDGVEIQGMLYLPPLGTWTKPYPLIVNAHGGPVYAYRDTWEGHYPYVAFLVSNGYAVLNANPHGSSGRGQAFAESIRGDYGGAEAQDLLDGLDALVSRGLADPKRLGITGGSHGGYLSAWLATQTCRFAAAVPRSPVTDYLMHYTTSNIAAYMRLFLDGSPYSSDSQFFTRSPLRFVDKCSTPVLQIVGAEDRCCAPEQAKQFHRALLEKGIASVVVEYPNEAHGIRGFPAYIDMCHRMLTWFQEYMPVSSH